MTIPSPRVGIAGSRVLGPAVELPGALDALIYNATSAALDDAGMSITDVDGACMAASDLLDGRAISTMTLTGSTGSFRKTEMRVCNDSLAAVLVGAAEVASGAADALIVCSWSKLSDADSNAVLPLAMEPVFHRALGFHPAAVLDLRRSAESGAATVTADQSLESRDVAVATILVAGDSPRARAHVIGFGASTGPYLRPGEPVLDPVRAAATAACDMAGVSVNDLSAVHVAGLARVDDDALADSLGVATGMLVRPAEPWADLGYAAGLTAMCRAHEAQTTGPVLVVSAGGLGYENAFAVVMEQT
ncbi:MAG: hypothetical protein JWO62_2339 [Acidimicrobiaceae bacterium]|nr:hypothetical protein [Acidimicrobiaceae bacterium]